MSSLLSASCDTEGIRIRPNNSIRNLSRLASIYSLITLISILALLISPSILIKRAKLPFFLLNRTLFLILSKLKKSIVMDRFSYLDNLDHSMIEEMYEKFLEDPESLEASWKDFFEGFEFCRKSYKAEKGEAYVVPNEFKVINLINAYRQRG